MVIDVNGANGICGEFPCEPGQGMQQRRRIDAAAERHVPFCTGDQVIAQLLPQDIEHLNCLQALCAAKQYGVRLP